LEHIMESILVINAGSSSVKFQTFSIDSETGQLRHEVKGQLDGLGARPCLRAISGEGQTLVNAEYDPAEVVNVSIGLRIVGEWLGSHTEMRPDAIGHRVVHGGAEYDSPVLLNARVVERLESFTPLAPLHQPHNLAAIRTFGQSLPGVPQVACFDTAFHRQHSRLADTYAIPERFIAHGIRRYGFHGLSYEYIAAKLTEIAPAIAKKKLVVAHLGNGASMCGLDNGRSVESTMGFTALDGIPMGTRPGQTDPGVILFLMKNLGLSVNELEYTLYHESGLKALSGISSDMRVLELSADDHAAFAIDYFAYRIAMHTGMLAAAMEGFDGFVFTGGIGENSPRIRAEVIRRLEWFGAELDVSANHRQAGLVSASASRIPVYVIPTDEELMIARHTMAMLSH
jgi:acetate kinase